jgi:hypothetical protein
MYAFLMSYPTFTTASEFMDLLNNRFHMPKPKNASKQQMSRFQNSRMMPIHYRIVNVLKNWISIYPEDFMNDPSCHSRLLELAHEWSETNTLLKPAFDGITKTLEKRVRNF